jgi:hypothetical protein
MELKLSGLGQANPITPEKTALERIGETAKQLPIKEIVVGLLIADDLRLRGKNCRLEEDLKEAQQSLADYETAKRMVATNPQASQQEDGTEIAIGIQEMCKNIKGSSDTNGVLLSGLKEIVNANGARICERMAAEFAIIAGESNHKYGFHSCEGILYETAIDAIASGSLPDNMSIAVAQTCNKSINNGISNDANKITLLNGLLVIEAASNDNSPEKAVASFSIETGKLMKLYKPVEIYQGAIDNIATMGAMTVPEALVKTCLETNKKLHGADRAKYLTKALEKIKDEPSTSDKMKKGANLALTSGKSISVDARIQLYQNTIEKFAKELGIKTGLLAKYF